VAAFDILADALREEMFKDRRVLLALSYDNLKVVKQNMMDIKTSDPAMVLSLILNKFRPHYWRSRAEVKSKKDRGGV